MMVPVKPQASTLNPYSPKLLGPTDPKLLIPNPRTLSSFATGLLRLRTPNPQPYHYGPLDPKDPY